MAHPTGRRLAPSVAVGLLIVAYVAVIGTMALRRHQNLRTNALDLGYTDQAVWNTLHGRPFRFSTYLDAAFYLDIPIQEFREPGVLLGYHVEPLLVPISLLYLLHDGPETLHGLQRLPEHDEAVERQQPGDDDVDVGRGQRDRLRGLPERREDPLAGQEEDGGRSHEGHGQDETSLDRPADGRRFPGEEH